MNEYRVLIPVDDKHSNSSDVNQIGTSINNMECKIHTMAFEPSEQEHNVSNGYTSNPLFFDKDIQINNKEVITYEINMERCQTNPDKVLDEVEFSDDENIEETNFKEEYNKICEYYEEDNTLYKYTGTKNELDERKEIPEKYKINENDNLALAGTIDDIVNEKVIVRVFIEYGVLDLDNLVFNTNGINFGYIDDVIGKVDTPYYVVKFFPDIEKNLVKREENIFFVNNKAKVISFSHLKKSGCDASNAFDEELLEEELEFSDDEIEQTQKKKSKSHKKRKIEYDNEYILQSSNNLKTKYSTNVNPNNVNLQNNNFYNPYYSAEYKLNSMYNPFPTQYMYNTINQNNNSFNPFSQQINPFLPPSQNNQNLNNVNK